MSDFLTNLAARALGAPTLRPRTRSRFDPEPETSPWIEAPAEPVAEQRAAQKESTSRRVDEPPSTAPLVDSKTRRLDDSPPPPRRETEPPPRIEPREVWSAEAAPPLSNLRANRKAEALPPHSTTVATHTEHHTTERVVERRVEHHDHTTVRVEPTSLRVDESTRERLLDDSETRRLEDSTPRHRYDEQPPRIERERREAMPALEPRPATPQRPRIEAPAAPEPTIHVSIGRVEVRAAAPAATPQRTRTRNAPMTLEDYAARRNAKGRP